MKNKSEQVSSTQLMFSVGCFIPGSTLLTFGLYSFVKQDAWIVVVSGYAVCLPILWIYITLAKRFPSLS